MSDPRSTTTPPPGAATAAGSSAAQTPNQGVLALQCRVARAKASALLEMSDSDRPVILAQTPAPRPSTSGGEGAAADSTAWIQAIGRVAKTVEPLGPSRVVPLEPDRRRMYGEPIGAHAVLMSAGSSPSGAARVEAFLINPNDERELKHTVELLELSRVLLDLNEARAVAGREAAKSRRLAEVVETIEAGQSIKGFRGSTMAWCNELCTRFHAERVSLGFVSGRYVRLAAMSQTEHLSRRMQAVQDLESTMEECLDQDLEVTYPVEPTTPLMTRAAAELSKKHGPSSVASLPLRDPSGEPKGVLTLERSPDRPFDAGDLTTLRLLCNLATPRLLELREHDRWFGARWAAATRAQAAKALGPQHTWAKVGAILALALVVFVFGFRGTDWVEGSFVVEPVVARTVPAPWEGYLAEVLVEPGDAVFAGETVLGRLDTADLRLELAQARAEEAQFRTEADVAWREGKQAERQIALARARQSAAQVALLEHRLSQADLVAPISGLVTQGDLKRELGRPVEKGQALFEVAPLDSLRGVMMVPEHRKYDVYVGQRGELATASHPGDKLPFIVERVYPVAEVVNQSNVFRVRVVPAGEPGEPEATRFDAAWLAPGVEGVAKADAGEAPFAWLWTRAPINWVRMKLWW